jgi:hypothetical protein
MVSVSAADAQTQGLDRDDFGLVSFRTHDSDRELITESGISAEAATHFSASRSRLLVGLPAGASFGID